MNESILKEMKKKKQLNKLKRNETNENEKGKRIEEWNSQREKVKKLIKEGIEAHEIMITNQIKDKNNGQKKLWEYINMIRMKKKKEEEGKVYNEEGKEINKDEIKTQTEEVWGKQLSAQGYDIEKVWNNSEKEKNAKRA